VVSPLYVAGGGKTEGGDLGVKWGRRCGFAGKLVNTGTFTAKKESCRCLEQQFEKRRGDNGVGKCRLPPPSDWDKIQESLTDSRVKKSGVVNQVVEEKEESRKGRTADGKTRN